MSEGNRLWRQYWHIKINALYGTVDHNDLRQSAWVCATAGASFTWCDHSNNLSAKDDEGLPFYGDHNSYTSSARYIDILTRVMNEEVIGYRMTPQDSLLSGHDSTALWSLAETGRQYLVFAIGGNSFTLNVTSGQYNNNIWLNAETGASQNTDPISGGLNKNFTPPNTSTDWVLILRTSDITAVDEGADTKNIDTDQSPRDFTLCQNFPNPFNYKDLMVSLYNFESPQNLTLTFFNLPADVTITVYTEYGDLAKRVQGSGTGDYKMKMVNEKGQSFASGIYVVVFQTPDGGFSYQKLVQEKLASDLGMSRTPLLKALQNLEHEMLVESIPRKGIYVRQISIQEMIDVYDCREAIESMAVKLLIDRAEDKELEKLKVIFKPFVNANKIATGHYRRADERFHDMIIDLSRNPVLKKMSGISEIHKRVYQL